MDEELERMTKMARDILLDQNDQVFDWLSEWLLEGDPTLCEEKLDHAYLTFYRELGWTNTMRRKDLPMVV